MQAHNDLPTHIGRYEIQAALARGGMGMVYLAWDPHMQRQVVVKVLRMELYHNPEMRQRFELEARLLALLEHPAIVPIYDVGGTNHSASGTDSSANGGAHSASETSQSVDQEGQQPFLVMRYLPGGTLAERLEHGPLPLEQVLELLLRLAPALDLAHSQGIIHRDLKPSNILFDQEGNPCITDFGVARVLSLQPRLTQESVPGTVAYMSPEQIQNSGEIDGRSDVYALGVMLFEMLCGRLPFDSDNPFELARMHLEQAAPSLETLEPDLPHGIDAILYRALAKSPSQRFPSAGSLALALEALLAGAAPDPANEATGALPPIPQQPQSAGLAKSAGPGENDRARPHGKATGSAPRFGGRVCASCGFHVPAEAAACPQCGGKQLLPETRLGQPKK